jgi:alpha-ribazole phosphatase
MILWTLRHTKPHNPHGYCYGRTDYDVADSFAAEYPGALAALAESQAGRLFSSPLTRCKRLAEKVSAQTGLPIETREEIIELHFGDWEEKLLAAVPNEQMNAWRNDLRGYRFPGGESFRDLDQRVLGFLNTCMQYDEVIWVSHAGVIASLMHYCGVPETDFVEGKLTYATVIRFKFTLSGNTPQGTFQIVHEGIPQPGLPV